MVRKNNIIAFLQAEHYKLWRNPSIWVMVCYPILVTAIVMLNVYNHRMDIISDGYNPWLLYSGRHIVVFFLFYPILAAIMCYSLFETERVHGNFRMLFVLPYKHRIIYVAKMIFMTEIVMLSMGVGILTFLSHGYILQALIPAAHYSDYDIVKLCMSYFSRLFISLLLISFLQYSLNLIFRNLVLPIGVSCFMVVFTLVAPNLSIGFLIPYFSSYHLINEFNQAATTLDRFDFVALAYIPVFLVVNYYLMLNRAHR